LANETVIPLVMAAMALSFRQVND